MKADDFWENAKPSRQTVESRPAWMTFDDSWVDEVRRGLKACTVFLWYPLYCEFQLLQHRIVANMAFEGLTYNQIISNLTCESVRPQKSCYVTYYFYSTAQAATLSTHGVPNDVINNLDPFALIIFIPICDLFVSTSFSLQYKYAH